jgi:hypothetical protein
LAYVEQFLAATYGTPRYFHVTGRASYHDETLQRIQRTTASAEPAGGGAKPSSNSSFDYRRSDAHIAEDGSPKDGGVNKSAKVVLGRLDNVCLEAKVAKSRGGMRLF